MDDWLLAKAHTVKTATFAACLFAILAGMYTSTEAQGERTSPRFIRYDRVSGVAPFSKRSGRNVMGSSPIDWDADGDLDLIADQHIYENNGRGVFKKGQMLGFLRRTADIAIADLNSDGKWDIIEGFWARPEIRVHYSLAREGPPGFALPKLLAAAELFESVRPANRSAPLSISIPFVADWNGDGLPDLLVSARDIWSDYFPYHPARGINRGGTTFGQIYGELYFLPNEGSRTEPKFPRAELVLMDGRPLVVFGISSPVTVDFDDDSDLDLLMTQEASPALYFENAGSRTKPLLKQPRHLYLDYPGIYSKLSVVDWDNDGLWDLLASSEDGEFLFRNTGKQGDPYFSGAYESLKEFAGPLWVPGFASPDAVEFDGDGDLDLVVGSDDGDFRLFENIGTQRQPLFAEGELLRYPDRFIYPDDTDLSKVIFALPVGADGSIGESAKLEHDQWYTLEISWRVELDPPKGGWPGRLVVSMNGREIATRPQLNRAQSGLSYLRLHSTAAGKDLAGFLVEHVAADVEP